MTVTGGGLYLPARRRIAWLRGEPRAHPDWTIDTEAEEVIRGEFTADGVVGGYARYRANVYDQEGRLIATGTKTEFSERFTDFVEKSETGAIARALAVAGFGTETALDLDEGYEQDRIADAPVMAPGADAGGIRPISITPSDVPGLRQGGRQDGITTAQVNEIARLARSLRLGAGLVPLIEDVSGGPVRALGEGEDPAGRVREALDTLTFEQAAALIGTLLADMRSGWSGTPGGRRTSMAPGPPRPSPGPGRTVKWDAATGHSGPGRGSALATGAIARRGTGGGSPPPAGSAPGDRGRGRDAVLRVSAPLGRAALLVDAREGQPGLAPHR